MSDRHPHRVHLLLLFIWLSLGTVLRFTQLDAKPLWTDEFSTLVFSLGHSFQSIPLNEPLTISTLLQPLRPDPPMGIAAVWERLATESNHPPLFFMLMQGWLQLFPTDAQGLVSAWSARSLSALFGVATIPAVFGLSRLAFRSDLVAHIAAVLMAVSPFSIYLAQEARHYTLPMLWAIASLCCLIVALRAVVDRTPLPLWVCGVWMLVNALGIATHYFVAFTLMAEAMVILGVGLWQQRWSSAWSRISSVALGTALAGLVWLPVWQNSQDSELTRWIYRGDRAGFALLEPLTQALGGWISMLYLFPVQATSDWLRVSSMVLLVLITLWTIPKLVQGLSHQWHSAHHLAVVGLGGVVIGAIALFLGVTYGLGMDVTSAFRYNFVYFPAVLVLVAAGLACDRFPSAPLQPQHRFNSAPPNDSQAQAIALSWQGLKPTQKRVIVLVGLLSLLGGLTVVTNLGFQKTHRPDLMVKAIRSNSEAPALVAIAHYTHGQTGRLMGIAWEWQRTSNENESDPQFLLAHQDDNPRSPLITLRRSLISLPRPLDLWIINFQRVSERPLRSLLEQQGCIATPKRRSIDGYQYALHRCSDSSNP